MPLNKFKGFVTGRLWGFWQPQKIAYNHRAVPDRPARKLADYDFVSEYLP